MSRRSNLILVMLFVLIAVNSVEAVSVSPFTDLSDDHWIYVELEKLVNAGLVREYRGGEALRKRPQLTRYEVALIVGRVYKRLEEQEESLVEDDLLRSGAGNWQAEALDKVFQAMDRPLWERIFIYTLTLSDYAKIVARSGADIARVREAAGEAASALVTLTGELNEEMSALGLSFSSVSVMEAVKSSASRNLGRLGFTQMRTGFATDLFAKTESSFLSLGLHLELVELKPPFDWKSL